MFGAVGIDGFAGPSDLVVLASAGADPHPLALDLLAQAEHGDDSFVVAVSADVPLLDALSREVQRLFRDRDTVAGGPKVLVQADSLETALAFSEALAPEHLQLAGADAEALAPRVTRAGCVFVGIESATAFGDYVAGSNHILPTDGAARFASGLNVGHFRRRMSEVHVGGAAGALAAAGVADRPRRAACPCTPSRWRRARARMGARDAPQRADQPPDRRDRRHGRRSTSTAATSALGTGVGFFDHMLELLARHGRLGLRVAVEGDLATGAHHTVEDTGIVLRPGARPRARRPGRDPPLRARAGPDGRGARAVRDRPLRPAVLRGRRPAGAAGRDRRLRARGWRRSSSAPWPARAA